MKNKFRVIGLRRSGNHAIISWLAHHFGKERVLFFNNIHLNSGLFSSENLKKYNQKLNKIRDCKPFIKTKLHGSYNDYDCLIYSYEDRNLSKLFSSKDKTILVIRDPYNVTASRIKQLEINKKQYWFSVDKRYINKVKQYLEECIGKQNLLGDKVIVNYNKWFTSKEYRKELSKILNLKFTDEGYSKMLYHGNGSSFRGVIKNTKSLKVLDRWKKYTNHHLFRKISEDKEILEMSRQIFGDIIK